MPKKKILKSTTISTLHKYGPGYTWNKGGRLKELRIRCLSRKFLHIWLKNTFGCLHPGFVIFHYEKKLVQKCFKVWHEYWWYIRKEWRLHVRAECHHRYMSLRRSMNVWIQYVHKRRKKHRKFNVIQDIANTYLKHCIFYAWKCYHMASILRKQDTNLAVNTRNTSVLRSTWIVWKLKLMLRQDSRNKEKVADIFRSQSLTFKYWVCWKQRWSESNKTKHRYFLAIAYNHRRIVCAALRSWKLYTVQEQVIKTDKDVADNFSQRTSLKCFFLNWKHKWTRRCVLKDQQDYLANVGQRLYLRTFLCRWKIFVIEKFDYDNKMFLATRVYNRNLLKHSFVALRQTVIHRNLQTIRQNLADSLYSKQILKKSYMNWFKKYEMKAEGYLVESNLRARSHNRHKLIQSAFLSLRANQVHKATEKKNREKADKKYFSVIAHRMLSHWWNFVQLRKENRNNKKVSSNFHRHHLYNKVFYHWKCKAVISQKVKKLERMAFIQYTERLRAKYFWMWQNKTQDVIEDRDKEILAIAYYYRQLCIKLLTHWKLSVDERNSWEQKELSACRHYSVYICRKCFDAWRQYYLLKLSKKKRSHLATSHLNRKTKSGIFNEWQSYVLQQRNKHEVAEGRYSSHCSRLLRETLFIWHNNVLDIKVDRRNESVANKHFRFLVMHKIWISWRRYAVLHAYKKEQTKELTNSSILQLQIGKTRRIFCYWKKATDLLVQENLLSAKAAQHYSDVCLKSTFHTWKFHTHHKLMLKLQQQQGDWFYSTNLIARYFLLWKARCCDNNLYKKKMNVALWQWCLTLEHKVFKAWLQYRDLRLEKKIRISQAQFRFRHRLLKEGVGQWISVACSRQDLRRSFADQQNAHKNHSTYQNVRKCFIHWRQRTLANVSEKRAIVGCKPEISLTSHKHVICSVQPSIFLPEKRRSKPRRPAFMIDMLKKDGLANLTFEECERESDAIISSSQLTHESSHSITKLPTSCTNKKPGFTSLTTDNIEMSEDIVPKVSSDHVTNNKSANVFSTMMKCGGQIISHNSTTSTTFTTHNPHILAKSRPDLNFHQPVLLSPSHFTSSNNMADSSSNGNKYGFNNKPIDNCGDHVIDSNQTVQVPTALSRTDTENSITRSTTSSDVHVNNDTQILAPSSEGRIVMNAEELHSIHARLLNYHNINTKLRNLEEIYARLTDVSYEQVDIDKSSIELEATEVMKEMTDLQTQISKSKEECVRLARRFQEFIS